MSDEKNAPTLRAKPAATTKDDHGYHLEVRGGEVHLCVDTRCYRVRGLAENLSAQQLSVNILARREELVHLDTLDLCKAKSRTAFIKATASELYLEEQTVKRDVGRLLLELEKLQQDQIDAATKTEPTAIELTDSERRAAMKLLRNPKLCDRIVSDYQAIGLVGEATNTLTCYLAAVSRLLQRPLAVLIQSTSAAGKSSLVDATLSFVPPEAQLRYSAMTGQSLYYMGQMDLSHKVLAIAEESGVAQASYALKLLQSDGQLRIAAAGRNAGAARQQTETYEVQGPVMMMLTTTAERPDPELQNRCLTLHVNESPDQTRAIHDHQRTAYTLKAQAANTKRQAICQLHQNVQRLLEPLPVIIPAAEKLRFRHDQTRMRREHAKYLALIAASALLHQYQRPRPKHDGTTYLEATADDVAIANRLLSELTGLNPDRLLPQTRQLLRLLTEYVQTQAKAENKPPALVRFTQRQLRQSLSWGDYGLRSHLNRLVELEYVLMHRSGYGNQRHYELLIEPQDGQPAAFGLGLIDPAKLPNRSNRK